MVKNSFGFWVVFLVAAMVGGTPTFGALSESDKAGVLIKNILGNPGAENGLAGVTVSGGTLTRTTTAANVGSGNAAFSWDSNSAGQTFTFATVPIPAGLYGRNIQVSCNIQGAGATHTLSVWDGLTASEPTSITSLSSYARTSINTVAASSGSLSLRLTSVSSNEPTIFADDCYVGEASNISQGGQASLYGAITVSGCAADWNVTSATYATPATQTGCSYTVEGAASAPSTNIPAIKFATLPPGEYAIVVSGYLYGGTTSSNTAYRIFDGTNASRDAVHGLADGTIYPTPAGTSHFSIKYTNPQNAVTLAIQAKSNVGTAYFGQSVAPMTIKVYRYPSTSEMTYTPNTTASSWTGYHTTAASWARTNAAYGALTPTGTPAIVQRTNTNFGTVTTAGSSLPGITFTPVGIYKYHVCAYVKASVGTANAHAAFKLTDGTTDVAEHGLRESANLYNTTPVCGEYQATGTAAVTLTLQCKVDSGACEIPSSTVAASSIEWEIFAINQSFPAPILVGNIVSQSTGTERLERARIANNGTCSITSQSGTWVSSVVNTGTGRCQMTIASGVFSSAPACNVSTDQPGAVSYAFIAGDTALSATNIHVGMANAAGAASDQPYAILCVGPR